ncbi:MAG: MFS transporter [Pseudomonadota bacterium]
MALTTRQKAGWGLADMGIVTFVVVKQLLVLAFLTTYLGVPIALAGALTTGILVFDILTDPVIGYLSDRTPGRFGRRAPWMAVGALVMAGGTIGLFAAPGAERPLLWVGGFFILATFGFTMTAIPYGAMAGEITQDPKERSAITGWRMAFASIGILVGGAAVPAIAGNTAEGHLTAALVVAPLIIGTVWISLYLTRQAPKIMDPAREGLAGSLRLVFSNRAFVTLFLLYGVMTLAVAILTAGLPFAALYLVTYPQTDPLAGPAGALGTMSILFAGFVIGALISQVLWVLLSGAIGKLWALITGLSLYVILLIVMFTILPATSLAFMAGMFVLAGMTNGAYQQIPWAIYPDLMDITRKQSGAAIEGAFSAVWLFGQKVANAIAPGLVGIILGVFGWQEGTGRLVMQSETALGALRVVMSLLPAAILLVAILGLLTVYRRSLARTLERA